MKRTQNSRLLELLADGQPHSHHEVYELRMVGHSRVTDLRKLGYTIHHFERKDARGEQLHWYELQRVPAEAPAIERSLGERARGDLEVLRRSRPAAVAQSVERDRAMVEVAGSRPASRSQSNAIERVEALMTPEGAGGWRQPGHPELMGDGSPRQESGTDGPSDGVGAETRREEGRVGSDPGSAPVAVEQSSLFDAPPADGARAGDGREYESAGFGCRPDLEAHLELVAIEEELAAIAEWGADDPERQAVLEARARVLNDRLVGWAA